jgi:type IV pilus assembly protein PilB
MEIQNRIGQILLRQGVIGKQLVQRAMEIQALNPQRKFGEILVDDLGVEHHAVYGCLATAYAFKEYELTADTIGDEETAFVREVLENLPEAVRARALAKRVIPLRVLDRRQEGLLIVTPDPTDPEIMSIAPHFGYRRPEIYYCRVEVVNELAERVFPPRNSFLESLRGQDAPILHEAEEDRIDEAALDAEINQSLLTNLVEGSLVEAVRQGASDIHIVPGQDDCTDFHFRVDGVLRLWHRQESTKPEALSAVVKDRTREVDRFERDTAQDGFMQREIDGHRIRFRVSIVPIAGAQPERKLESIVIRILDDRKVVKDLGALGLQRNALESFEEALDRPQGMVILTGPTGSGKSTTLNAALHSVMDPGLCVLTVEDPVEYVINGARQIKLGHNLRFEEAVRAILRHDPDIVMVGEIRDLETAQTAIKLSNTGHLTFSTLHTNDAPSAVSRLFKMGVEPFLIANAVSIVVAQRLVRTLCPHCKELLAAGGVDRRAYRKAGMSDALLEEAQLFGAGGCSKCNDTGYKGRAGIHEAMLFSREIRQQVLEAGNMVDEDSIRRMAVEQGMDTLRQSGLRRVAAGETSLEAVLAATSADE